MPLFDEGMLAYMVERYGADRLFLGTDDPYDMGVADPVGFIEGVPGLTRAQRDLIEGGNAARLLKISPEKITAAGAGQKT